MKSAYIINYNRGILLMKRLLLTGTLILAGLLLLEAEEAEAQFFPHNDTTFSFVSTTNAFGRIQTYDGADGRYDSVEDKMIDRFYQLVGLNDSYVWNPNDDPDDFALVDTVYYTGADSLEYVRELLMDNSFRSNPPVDLEVHTLVRMFKEQRYGLARLGVIRLEDEEFKFTALLRGKIFEQFGGETLEWDANTERLYIFNNDGSIGLQSLTHDPVGVVLLDFDEYDSTDPLRDNARDFARWDIVEQEGFPASSITAGPDGGWAFMNFGNISQIATGDTAYVWLAFTHGSDLDDVDDMLDLAVEKAEELGIIETEPPVSTEPGLDLPNKLSLEQNYPNPFNPSTMIRFDLPASGEVTLDVFDVNGRRVATVLNQHMSAGTHSIQFDASSLASGTYMYRLQSAGEVVTRMMTLIK
ncbi:MAG: T9SS type A sorting domain-containing protein [Balneolales bacterium]|nr:T9SS type A sorting domain-containing protein [Balneolales bacterium]